MTTSTAGRGLPRGSPRPAVDVVIQPAGKFSSGSTHFGGIVLLRILFFRVSEGWATPYAREHGEKKHHDR